MRKVVANEWMSLDGVIQAPGQADEDTSGGFRHGGWHLPYFDELSQGWVVDGLAEAGGFLLGRRTYEILAAYWPNASPEESAVAEPLNTKPKYVASRRLEEPLGWHNAVLLGGNVAHAVASLKETDGDDLHVLGSGELVHTLLAHGLVDELRLMIDPLLVGGGKRLFPDDGGLRRLDLSGSRITGTGALLATYVLR